MHIRIQVRAFGELEFEKFEILGVDTAARRAGEDCVSLESAM
jgi:hypothetical protein